MYAWYFERNDEHACRQFMGLSQCLIPQYAFYHIQNGKLKSWQWLHITIAIVSFICSGTFLIT